MNTVDSGMAMRIADSADYVREAMRTLVAYNVEVAVPDHAGGVDLDIAQRLVDNATVLLEQAKMYQRRLKAHKRQQDRDMARWAREAYKAGQACTNCGCRVDAHDSMGHCDHPGRSLCKCR